MTERDSGGGALRLFPVERTICVYAFIASIMCEWSKRYVVAVDSFYANSGNLRGEISE